MPTPVSHSEPYLSAEEFLARIDYRTVADFLGDDGQRLTRPEVLASPVLQTLLMQASGEAEAAALTGGRYTVEDLTGLTGNSLEYWQGIIAGCALPMLWDRRPNKKPPELHIEAWAQGKLALLGAGENVLGLADQIEAGNPDSYYETPEDADARVLATFQARRFFGRRANDYRSPLH